MKWIRISNTFINLENIVTFTITDRTDIHYGEDKYDIHFCTVDGVAFNLYATKDETQLLVTYVGWHFVRQ